MHVTTGDHSRARCRARRPRRPRRPARPTMDFVTTTKTRCCALGSVRHRALHLCASLGSCSLNDIRTHILLRCVGYITPPKVRRPLVDLNTMVHAPGKPAPPQWPM